VSRYKGPRQGGCMDCKDETCIQGAHEAKARLVSLKCKVH